MKFTLLFIFFLILFSVESNGQRGWKTVKPIRDTSLLSELLIETQECTPCADAEVDSGIIRLPDSLLKLTGKHFQSSIYFSDVNIFTKLFGDYDSKKFNYTYLVKGKAVDVRPPNKAQKYVPVFEVYQYKLVRKKRSYEENRPEQDITAQQPKLKWTLVDSLFQPLPSSVHIYKTTDSLDGKPNIAYYVEADLKDKKLEFTADTTRDRRITPQRFYERNNNALVVVNCTFFSYETNRSLNTVIKDGKLVGYNMHSVAGRGKDTLTYRHPLSSAIGISRKRTADVAWLYTDSSKKYPYSIQSAIGEPSKDSIANPSFRHKVPRPPVMFGMDVYYSPAFDKWKMKTAVGGGPVLIYNREIKITNNEELKFAGKAINDKHPRTAMGYTKDNKLVILLVQGRFPGIAEGATLTQEAQLLKDIGCNEALNLDGGGSSCLLVNGKETIKPSDKEGQRPVPAVFLIRSSN